jgi:hypothetical protein
MLFLLQQPVVVELKRTQEASRITYPDVILSAFGVAGIIMLVAILFGLAAGWLIIYRKRRAEAETRSGGTDHVRLGI